MFKQDSSQTMVDLPWLNQFQKKQINIIYCDKFMYLISSDVTK